MQFINLQIAMLLDLVANAKIKEHINLFGSLTKEYVIFTFTNMPLYMNH